MDHGTDLNIRSRVQNFVQWVEGTPLCVKYQVRDLGHLESLSAPYLTSLDGLPIMQNGPLDGLK